MRARERGSSVCHIPMSVTTREAGGLRGQARRSGYLGGGLSNPPLIIYNTITQLACI